MLRLRNPPPLFSTTSLTPPHLRAYGTLSCSTPTTQYGLSSSLSLCLSQPLRGYDLTLPSRLRTAVHGRYSVSVPTPFLIRLITDITPQLCSLTHSLVIPILPS